LLDSLSLTILTPESLVVEITGKRNDADIVTFTQAILPPTETYPSETLTLQLPKEIVSKLNVLLRPLDKDSKGKIRLAEVGVLEGSQTDYVSLNDRITTKSSQLNLLAAPFGSTIIATGCRSKRPASFLNDGQVAALRGGSRDARGWTASCTDKELASKFPLMLTIEPGPVIKASDIIIDSLVINPAAQHGSGFSTMRDMRRGMRATPKNFRIETQTAAGDWEQRGAERSLHTVPFPQKFSLPNISASTPFRLAISSNYGSEWFTLGEVELWAKAESAQVLPANIFDLRLGSSVVFNSVPEQGSRGDPIDVLQEEGMWVFRQEPDKDITILLRTAPYAEATLGTLKLIPADRNSPVSVRVEVSNADSPLSSWERIHEEASVPWKKPQEPLEFSLVKPKAVKFLRLTFSSTKGTIKLKQIRGEGTLSVSRITTKIKSQQPREALKLIREQEPNNTTSQAMIVPAETRVGGEIKPEEDKDTYTFLLPANGASPAAVLKVFTQQSLEVRSPKGTETKELAAIALYRDTAVTLESPPFRLMGSSTPPLVFARAPLATQLVLDESGSMQESAQLVSAAVQHFIKGIHDREKLGILTFSDSVRERIPLTDDKEVLRHTFQQGLSPNGRTALFDALAQATKKLEAEPIPTRKALVLLSDGADSASKQTTLSDVWQQAVIPGSPEVFALTLGQDSNALIPKLGQTGATMLSLLPQITGGQSFFATTVDQVEQAYRDIDAILRGAIKYQAWIEQKPFSGSLQLQRKKPAVANTKKWLVGLLFDASGSMNARAQDGRSRLQLAKRAMKQVITKLDNNTQLVVHAFGDRLPKEPKHKSCEDYHSLFGESAATPNKALGALEQLKAQGQTPLGAALRNIAQDIVSRGAENPHIVVVTDGTESCAASPESPDWPNQVVAELKERGVLVTLSIIGLSVTDEKEHAELAELALASSGGQYYAVGDESDLAEALQKSLAERFVVRDLFGEVLGQGLVNGDPVPLPLGVMRVEVEGSNNSSDVRIGGEEILWLE
jgi:Mg-chelatase subunit ChlD